MVKDVKAIIFDAEDVLWDGITSIGRGMCSQRNSQIFIDNE